MKLHNIYRFIINFFYPNTCPSCGTIIGYNDDFCEACKSGLTRVEKRCCVENADGFAAYCLYADAAEMLLRFKKDACGNSYYAFACGIFRAITDEGFADKIDEIVFIPMTKSDYRQRGFNQTELIARELRFMLGVPCRKGLVKLRATRHQKELSGEERKTNVVNAFQAADGFRFDGKTVLVIDDVCTTGSTLSEAARALRAAGAEHIYAAAFAKTDKS